MSLIYMMPETADKLRKWMVRHRYSQASFGRALEHKKSRQQINQVLMGNVPMSSTLIRDIYITTDGNVTFWDLFDLAPPP